MRFENSTERSSFRRHTAEGSVYLSTSGLLSAQTVFPALVTLLGGNNAVVGTLPVITYLAFLLPQVHAVNRAGAGSYRKPWVLRMGIIQRLHIAGLAIVVGVFGAWMPALALLLFFLLYASNQVHGGLGSPVWYEFVVKTIPLRIRGRMLGIRTSIGAALGFVNGGILTAILAGVAFPYNFSLVFALGFLLQLTSWLILRTIDEQAPSQPRPALGTAGLLKSAMALVRMNGHFRRFLVASSLLTVSFSSVAFFTVYALKRFDAGESAVGVFTLLTMGAQMISGVSLGWISDRYGTKPSLLLCGGSLLMAIVLTLAAKSLLWMYPVFVFMGINVGGELINRYNYAVECSTERDRSMYVAVMNTWLAPFYVAGIGAGALTDAFGYEPVFTGCLLVGVAGLLLLAQVPDPRQSKLAVSSKLP